MNHNKKGNIPNPDLLSKNEDYIKPLETGEAPRIPKSIDFSDYEGPLELPNK